VLATVRLARHYASPALLSRWAPCRLEQPADGPNRAIGRVLARSPIDYSSRVPSQALEVDCGLGLVTTAESYVPEEVDHLPDGSLITLDAYVDVFPEAPRPAFVHVDRLRPDVRAAILRHYGPEAAEQSETDPRWIEEWQRSHAEADVQSSDGRYGRYLYKSWCVRVSELGPFVDVHVPPVGFVPAIRDNRFDPGFRGPPPAVRQRLTEALDGTPWSSSSRAPLCNQLTGLRVYLFRRNAKLTVADALFYWQD